jgi:transposase
MANKLLQSTKDVWALRNKGFGNKQIAEILGLSIQTVNSAIRRGREQGTVKRVRPAPDRFIGTKVKRGNVSDVLASISEEQREWLLKTTNQTGCDTVAEYITEMVRDQYEMEVVQGAA